MQPGNRVVLTCVGGRDSFAVFEAAKDDAAAVLFVGELRKKYKVWRYGSTVVYGADDFG